MRVGVYLRISEDREGRELGVTRQREDCLALAARLGATVHDVYQDNDRGASTRSRKARKGYRRLLDDARAGRIGMVIAYTSGRLTRRPREHEDQIELAERHGIQFRYVASPDFDLNTAAGRRIARILAANDTGEAEDISERSVREARQRAEQGRPHGGPRAYGFTSDGRATIEDEAERIKDWYAVILAGGTVHAIAKRLHREDVLTDAGRPFHYSSIRAIVLNPRNAGIRFLHGEVYPSPGPAIVTEETWRATVAILTDPTRRTNHHGTARKWLGAGLYICDRCSGGDDIQRVVTFYASFKGRGYRTYQCRGCGRSWKAEPIDEWVVDLVAARLAQRDVADFLVAQGEQTTDVSGVRAEAMGARARLNQLAEEFADGVLTAEQLRVATERLRSRLAQLEQALVSAGSTGPLAVLAAATDPAAAWFALGPDDIERRQAIVRGLVEIRLGAPIRGRAMWVAEKFISVEWVKP